MSIITALSTLIVFGIQVIFWFAIASIVLWVLLAMFE